MLCAGPRSTRLLVCPTAVSRGTSSLRTGLSISVIPGANRLLGLWNAYREGACVALLAVCGRLAAFAVMVVLVSAGLGALLLQSEQLFTAVKWIGVAYLLYLGVFLIGFAAYFATSRRPA